jgi:4-hydroxybenzoate polyprenyltransferase
MAAPSAATLVRALRPRQWTKNLGVYAPLLFAKAVFVPGAALHATFAVLSFCLISSGVYVMNDWVDRERDRQHPEKRHRPIASGLISGPVAAAMVAGCWAAGFALALAARFEFAALVLGYVGLQVAYTLVLKHLVIVDVCAIAAGFVVRVVGGGVAIDVPVSNWLFLCTLLLAVFLGFAKRRHELTSLQAEAASHRANLSEYSLPMLDQMIAVVAAACLVAYGIYSVSPETIAHVGSDRMKYTVPFVMYGFFRYLFLVHRRGAGGSPERVLLSDPALLADVGLFAAAAAWALYGS